MKMARSHRFLLGVVGIAKHFGSCIPEEQVRFLHFYQAIFILSLIYAERVHSSGPSCRPHRPYQYHELPTSDCQPVVLYEVLHALTSNQTLSHRD